MAERPAVIPFFGPVRIKEEVMLKAVLFDSDGLLVDTEHPFFEATREAFARDKTAISPDQWAAWYLAEGKRSREIGLLLGIPPRRIEETIEYRDFLIRGRLEAGVDVFPGVRETLIQLSTRFRLAVVTGSSRSRFERPGGRGLTSWRESRDLRRCAMRRHTHLID